MNESEQSTARPAPEYGITWGKDCKYCDRYQRPCGRHERPHG